MSRYEQEWCDALVAAVGGSSDFSHGELIRILYIVTDTEEGKVAFNVSDDGTELTATAGKYPRGVKADITITVKESVLVDLWSGSRTRDGAFMAGDIKIEGAYARWLDELVPAFAESPWYEAWAAAV